jgi:hypothetical protein
MFAPSPAGQDSPGRPPAKRMRLESGVVAHSDSSGTICCYILVTI